MTYNIAAGVRGLDGIAETIAAARPDIAALQEVDVHWSERSQFADQARALGDRLRMNQRFAEIYRLPSSMPDTPAREFGVALLSRYPIDEFRNRPLTRLSTQESSLVPTPAPGLLEAHLDIGRTRIRVFNTHLDYRADPSVRQRQVAEMVEAIGALHVPTLVFGDLNAEPHAPELAPLLSRIHDAWPASAGPGFTYPADMPTKRIDYVLVSPHFRVASAAVPAASTSDHRAVVMELLADF